jgi:hypothetical protein
LKSEKEWIKKSFDSNRISTPMRSSTDAIGMAIGEFIGTTIAPRTLGSMGDMYGLRTIFLVAGISTTGAFLITLGLTETGKPIQPCIFAGRPTGADR